MTQPEFSRIVRLEDIDENGMEFAFEANAAECTALAKRFSIPEVAAFSGSARLDRVAPGAVTVAGRVSARLIRDCVVTLEPVQEALDEDFALKFLGEGVAATDPEEVAVDDGVVVEELTEDVVDVGELAVQFTALAMDPYPKAPGAEFQSETAGGDTSDTVNSPFSILKGLKGEKP